MKRPLLLLALLSLTQVSYGQTPSYIPVTGLQLFMPFSGNANDLSGNGNNGTVYNCTLNNGQAGAPNTAYDFDGVSSYIKVADAPSLRPHSITMYAKVYPTGFYTGTCNTTMILGKGISDNPWEPGNYSMRYISGVNGDCYVTDTTHQDFVGAVHLGPPLPVLNTTPYVKTNEWYNIVSTYASDTITTYVNGVLRHKTYLGGGMGTNNYDLLIGRWNDNNFPYWYKGKIDELAIWDRPLDACEIAKLTRGGFVAAQPVNQYALVGSNAVFTVSSSLSSGTSYQWQMSNGGPYTDLSNGGQYSGVHTAALTVSGISTSNIGMSFRCILSAGTGCTDTSSAAMLTNNVAVGSVGSKATALFQNSPNPVWASTGIGYYIASLKQAARINVYDAAGKLITSSVITKVGEGMLQLNGLRAGVYTYDLSVDGLRVDVKRMTILQ